eukprot:Hpha_TRINITY_DN16840_c2_g1::TRINITY_DN16840_c2_g1_i1::g.152421::m.152421
MSLARMMMAAEVRRAHRYSVLGETRQDSILDGMEYNTLTDSCYHWGPRSKCRQCCIRLVDDSRFDMTILVVIVLNCITLAMDDPSYNEKESIRDFLYFSGLVFLAIFTVECAIKICALGFACHRGSYLRSTWNVLDFIAVVVGLLGVFGGAGVNLTILRALRILRPLRMVSRLKELRLLIQTIITSVPLIADVFLLLGFMVLIFGILGLQLWAGALHHHCFIPAGTVIPHDMQTNLSVEEAASLDPFLDQKRTTLTSMFLVNNDSDVCGKGRACEDNGLSLPQECAANLSVARGPISGFDNIGQAALLVLKVASLDDWPQDMAHFQQRSGHVAWVYFGFLTLFGNYFVFNLVLAVLSSAFSTARARVNPEKPAAIPWLRCHHSLGAAVLLHLESIICAELSNHGTVSCDISLSAGGYWSGSSWVRAMPEDVMVMVQEDMQEHDDGEETSSSECDTDSTGSAETAGDEEEEEDEEEVMSMGVQAVIKRWEDTSKLFDVKGRHVRWVHRARMLTEQWQKKKLKCDYVSVFIISGKKLIKADKEKSDPYCMVDVAVNGVDSGADAKQRSTDHRSDTRDPVWNQAIDFPLPGSITNDGMIDLTVKLTVQDYDSGSHHDFMGYAEYHQQVSMGSSSCIELEPVTVELGPRPGVKSDLVRDIQITRAQSDGRGWGKVVFRVSIHDQADDEESAADHALDELVGGLAGPSRSRSPSQDGDDHTHISTQDSERLEAAAQDLVVQEANEERIQVRDRRKYLAAVGIGKEARKHIKALPECHQEMWMQVHAPWFVGIFIAVTFINVGALAADHYPAGDGLLYVIDQINFSCTILFSIEAVTKLSVMGVYYFHDGYNIFDFVLVVLSLPDLFVSSNSSQLTVLRVLRLLRAVKLLQRFPSLRQVILTVIQSASQVFWLWCLIMLFMFIYAVLGMHLFGTRFEYSGTDMHDPNLPEPYDRLKTPVSFASFWESLLAVFVMTTGEGWGSLMWVTMESQGWYSFLYSVSAFLLGNCILLNLFVAILVDNADRADEREQAEELKERQLAGRSDEVGEERQRAMELDRMQMELNTGVGGVCGADEADFLCIKNTRKGGAKDGEGFFAKREAIGAGAKRVDPAKKVNKVILYPVGCPVKHPRRGEGAVTEIDTSEAETRWKVQFQEGGEHWYRLDQMQKLSYALPGDPGLEGLRTPDTHSGDAPVAERAVSQKARRHSRVTGVTFAQPSTNDEEEGPADLIPLDHDQGYQPSAVERVLAPRSDTIRRGSHLVTTAESCRHELLSGVPRASLELYEKELEGLSAEDIRGGPLGDALRTRVETTVPKSALEPGGVKLGTRNQSIYRCGDVFVEDVRQGFLSNSDVLVPGTQVLSISGMSVGAIDDVDDAIGLDAPRDDEALLNDQGQSFYDVMKVIGRSEEPVDVTLYEPGAADLLDNSKRYWRRRRELHRTLKPEVEKNLQNLRELSIFQAFGYGEGALQRVLGVGQTELMSNRAGEFFSQRCYRDWRARLKTADFGPKSKKTVFARLASALWKCLREERPAMNWKEIPDTDVSEELKDPDGMPAGDLEEVRRWCLSKGHGGFVVSMGVAHSIELPSYELRRRVDKNTADVLSVESCSIHCPAADPVMEEPSLGCIYEASCLRQNLARVVRADWFEVVITLLIFLNMIVIAIDNPEIEDSNPELSNAIEMSDIAFATLFVMECVAKIIVLGFCQGDHAYCSDKWNVVDLIVAISAVVGIPIKSVRFLRALRTIRLIVRILEVRLMVEWLFLTLPRVGSTVQLLFFFILTWAILGVQFFKGMYGFCSNQKVLNEELCVGTYIHNESTAFGEIQINDTAQWEKLPYHFDNVGSAMFSLFIMAIGDDWATLMYFGIDATGSNPKAGFRSGPVHNSSPWMSLYFVLFVVIGQFFLMNLFVGVLINTFVKTKERETGQAELTSNQVSWIQAQRLMLQTPLDPIIPTPAESDCCRQFCYFLSLNPAFERFVSIAICVNAILMGVSHYNEPAILSEFGQVSNIGFVAIFALEAIVKAIGLTPKYYFRDNWNRFDVVVVVMSLVGTFSGSGGSMSVLRLFRVLRLVRLLNKSRGLRTLVNAMIHSLPHLWNVTLLLLVVFFMFGIAGVQLFGRVNHNAGQGLTPHTNFRNIYYALVTLYQIASTEGWVEVMFGTMIGAPHCDPDMDPTDCGAPEWVSRTYFLLFMIIGSALILNLFVTVVVDRYNDASEAAQHSNRLQSLDTFVQKWRQQDPEASKMVLANKAIAILESLPEELWDSRKELVDSGKLTKFIVTLRNLEKLCVPVGVSKLTGRWRQHVVRYNDVVSCLAARIYNLTSFQTIKDYQVQVDRNPSLLGKLGRGFDEDKPLDKRVVHPLCAAFAVQKLSPWQLRGPSRYYELHHLHAVNVVVRRMRLFVTAKPLRLQQKKQLIMNRLASQQTALLMADKEALLADTLVLERTVKVLDGLARLKRDGRGPAAAAEAAEPPATAGSNPLDEPKAWRRPSSGLKMSPDGAGGYGGYMEQSNTESVEFSFDRPTDRLGVDPDAHDHVNDYREHTQTPPHRYRDGDLVYVWYPEGDKSGEWLSGVIRGQGQRAYSVQLTSGTVAEGILDDCLYSRQSSSPPHQPQPRSRTGLHEGDKVLAWTPIGRDSSGHEWKPATVLGVSVEGLATIEFIDGSPPESGVQPSRLRLVPANRWRERPPLAIADARGRRPGVSEAVGGVLDDAHSDDTSFGC